MSSRKRGKNSKSKRGSPSSSVSRSPPQAEHRSLESGVVNAGTDSQSQAGDENGIGSDGTPEPTPTVSKTPVASAVAGNGNGGNNAEEKAEAADVVSPLPQGTPNNIRRIAGAGLSRTPSKGQDARIVYYDPGDVLPEKDKPMVPGGEKAAAEEALRYKQRWLFTPATLLSAVDSEPGVSLIRTKDKGVHRVRAEKLRTVNPQALEGVPDAMSLSDLSDASLLHTLRERYSRDEVYTRVGPVLMSINPYKWIKGLYTEAAMMAYHGKASTVEAEELAPHLFGVADHAYSQLVQGHLNASTEAHDDMQERTSRASNQCNQSIIISGESGSGKTEATKIIMQYLARITSEGDSSEQSMKKSSPGGKAAGGGGSLHVGELEERVLSCNPLLESFGNARTLKNDNSSRFGKFIKIQFDKKGRIRGAQIENYLLEKTRIVNQAKRERSYHVFYQLLAGASSPVKNALKLEKGVAGFECLKGSTSVARDAEEFEVTKACLVKIGIDQTKQGGIFKLLAAVLHLLNVGFVSANEGEGCEVKEATRPSLTLTAELLGVECDELEKALVSKTMSVHRGSTTMLQTKEQAHDKAGALGKALYSQLFLWLVSRLNTTIAAPDSDEWGFIGVLDIYGFEHFNVNSLEQLLINYANEQLQRHFNQHMFEVEQSEYEKEQIDWSYIKFNDNKACLELIDGRPGGKAGVLAALDDIQRFKGGEANTQFLSHLRANFAPSSGVGMSGGRGRSSPSSTGGADRGGHPHFLVPRFDENSSFGIKHYAGDVIYSIRNFNEKNRENLSKDIKTLVGNSTNELVAEVFAVGAQDSADEDSDETPMSGTPGSMAARVRGGGRIREASVGAQFKQSLAGLIGTISTTQPRYIRCVKPNPDKERDRLDALEVLRQLQYSGMMETIRIRRQGYALRELHDDFFRKYSVLEPKANDVEELVALLSRTLRVSEENWQIGNSKVFLRNSMSDKLNLLVELRRKSAARVIQRWARYARRRAVVRTTIQPFLSNSVKMLKYLRAAAYFKDLTLRRQSATAILRWYHTAKDRRRFLTVRTAAIVIQACARRRHAVLQLELRKEFPKTPVDELFVKLEELRAKLDEAVKANDFASCSALNGRIHHLSLLAQERGVEAERCKNLLAASGGNGGAASGESGPTREEIEIGLLEAVWRMNDAEAEHDYSLCSKLQMEMKALEELRDQKPTLSELKDRAEQTKADIDKFASQADYGRAGSLQTKLGEMEEAIATMEDEKARAESQDGQEGAGGKFSEMSPKELDDLTTKTREELEAAKAKKDFVKCMELQARLTELSAASASMPSLSQVEEEVLSAEAEMAAAKARKDYRRAAELSVKLPAMHDRHSALALSIRKAMGRKQLSEEIQRLEGEMRLAKAEKRFNKCSLLQKDLVELQKLTEALPTVSDLEDEILEVRGQMDIAVTQRKYAEAEQYRARLTELADDKALALEQEQSPTPPRDAFDRAKRRSFSPADRVTRGNGGMPDASGAEEVQPLPPPPPPQDDLGYTSPQPVRLKQPASVSPMPARSAVPVPARVSSVRGMAAGGGVKDDRSVARLRPKPAVTMPQESTVAKVCVALARARSDAGLLTGAGGVMTGIVTAIDLTRRVVAVGMDPNSTAVSQVMTPNPTTVRTDDGAMEALGIMMERHFRHLPVKSPSGEVTGVLDIAKCLYDAVSRLEKVSDRTGEPGGGAEGALQQSVMALAELGKGNGKGKGKKGKAAMAAMLAKLFEDQGAAPSTLGDLLEEKGEPQLVRSDDSVRAAGKAIARGRKAVLVVDDMGLAGIFTEKDLLNRVLAKGLDPDHTSVSEVMTPNPDTVPSTMTVLAALQEMHQNKYLHLPVVDESTGTVSGVVNVMEIMQATAGEHGSEGWKALFGSALDTGDDFSDAASMTSMGSVGTRSSRRPAARLSIAPSVASTSRSKAAKAVDARPVSVLKPKPPLCLSSSLTLFEVAKGMSDVRTDAVILLDSQGHVEGILTDHDITRRALAPRIDPKSTLVSEVMTPHPTMVRMDDSAMDCLGIMIERRFRHLPVVDGYGNIAGLLSIARCLYDAIHRLEKKAIKAEEKAAAGGDTADIAASFLKAASAGKGKNRGRTKAKDLTAVLAMLMADGDGAEAEPTLGDLLSEETSSFIDGGDTVTSAAIVIAKARKAVLALDDGHLAGIVTPKDLLNRVVAKGLNPDTTRVSSIMTPNPDTVPPDMTVIDALREMHENKYLHLPVVDEDTGIVQGVVSVMEIVQATAGSKGSSRWEAFFGSAMEATDDVSDSASMYSVDRSVRSIRSVRPGGTRGRESMSKAGTGSVAASVRAAAPEQHRPVSSLKPKPPLCVPVELTVAQVAMRMAEVRTDAAILLGAQGDMKGILTDSDVARKVVGGSLDADETPVATVMTPNPLWVNTTDSAMEALGTMLEKHFRHLPVVDGDGAVSGLLNIAKCLYDAIHRLEKKARKAEEEKARAGGDQDMAAMLKMQAKRAVGKGGKNAKALAAMAALLKGLEDGEEEPTLGGILAAQASVFVGPQDTIADAGKAIARSKKAVLVVTRGRLVGIVTPKDVLMRVVAKGLDPGSTTVSNIMTPNPDAVPPDMTVVDALKEMHENKYLHLPVVDEDSGEVIGVVNVMEIIQATAGDKGSERWEAFFGSAMEAGDDVSDSASMYSMDKSVRSMRSVRRGSVGRTPGMSAAAPSVSGSVMTRKEKEKPPKRNDKPVSSLRLKRPIIMSCDGSVLDVAMEMALKRTDAALLTRRGALAGIVTDHDLTRRVIALDKAPDRTAVREVMTPDPAMVNIDESAMEALGLMLDNKTRHLPVMDGSGKVRGLLDIAKCLYDAVHRMEKQAIKQEEEDEGSGDNAAVLGAMVEAAKAMKAKGKTAAKHHKAIQELMMMAISGGGGSREGANKTLEDVLHSKEKPEFVRPRHTVREAASVIDAQKKAVLVVEEGELVGIFTPRDMLNRVIAKKLSPSTTAVSSVMTSNPDGGPPTLTVLEALQQMCDNRYLHMPVVDEDSGEVMGVVDVMEIIEAMVGQEGSAGWEAFFGSAMDADDRSDTMSQGSLRSQRSQYSTNRRHQTPSASTKSAEGKGGAHQFAVPLPRAPTKPSQGIAIVARVPDMEPPQSPNRGDGMSEMSRDVGGLELEEGWDEKFVYKVSDSAGHTHKFKASAERLDGVLQAVSEKLKMPKDNILLKYSDDDGDQIVLGGDDSLREAIDMARGSSAPALKLTASAKLATLHEGDDNSVSSSKTAKGATSNTALIGAGVVVVGILAVVGVVLSKKKG